MWGKVGISYILNQKSPPPLISDREPICEIGLLHRTKPHSYARLEKSPRGIHYGALHCGLCGTIDQVLFGCA